MHPRNPDLVYVAATGRAFGRNEERGVYRSTDGGASWEKMLYINDRVGAIDLAINPGNPRQIFAAMWQVERKPWTMISGGKEGGVYRSSDGGDTWTKLEKGLPEGLTGRIGVAVSPVTPNRVWAIVEAEERKAGVYRSEDSGDSWSQVNDNPRLLVRPWYYNHIYADPGNANTVWVAGGTFWKSVDGGKSFDSLEMPHGDHHALWLNPDNPDVMVQGNDGGAIVSVDGGESWSPQFNQPTAEFYSLTVDERFPYRVYGPQQDNSTISVPSQSTGTGITFQHWLAVGGCETGPVAVRPDDPKHRLLGMLRWKAGAVRPAHRAVPSDSRLPAATGRQPCPRSALSNPVERPHRALPPRSRHPLSRLAIRAPQHERRSELGDHQPRPHPKR